MLAAALVAHADWTEDIASSVAAWESCAPGNVWTAESFDACVDIARVEGWCRSGRLPGEPGLLARADLRAAATAACDSPLAAGRYVLDPRCSFGPIQGDGDIALRI